MNQTREELAKQIGLLVIANVEQANLIVALQKQIEEYQQAENKKTE